MSKVYLILGVFEGGSNPEYKIVRKPESPLYATFRKGDRFLLKTVEGKLAVRVYDVMFDLENNDSIMIYAVIPQKDLKKVLAFKGIEWDEIPDSLP